MRDPPNFDALSQQLLERGVSRKFALRIRLELAEHYTDLESELLAAARSPTEAAAEARARLGNDTVIAREFLRRPSLRSWLYRSRWFLCCVKVAICVLDTVLLPIQVVFVRRAAIARYGAASGAAVLVTAVTLLVLNIAIHDAPETESGPRLLVVSIEPQGVSEPKPLAENVPEREKPARPETFATLPPGTDKPVVLPGNVPEPQLNIELSMNSASALLFDATILNPRGVRMRLPDGEYLPLVKVAPTYPALAASRGLEGYVVIEFTVTRTGSVRDITVVESSNELFHKAAIDAASRFKYKPRVVEGQPVDVERVRNKITFVLRA